jgi:hypothetical protein
MCPIKYSLRTCASTCYTGSPSQGCLPPAHGNRAQYCISTSVTIDRACPRTGNSGKRAGRSWNQAKVFTASAAELSALANFPLVSS